jgi:hypothetical protein
MLADKLEAAAGVLVDLMQHLDAEHLKVTFEDADTRELTVIAVARGGAAKAVVDRLEAYDEEHNLKGV